MPHAWTQPVNIDNGYEFLAHQPIEVMQYVCSNYLVIHEYEYWSEDPNFTALALAGPAEQAQVETILGRLREQAYQQSYLEWLNDESSMTAAQIVLDILQWPLLLGKQPPLTQERLHELLDSETYGTFTAALRNPEQWR
ncbi:hypothetical protein KRX19_02320 [Cardiobacteriaceae bacterium TAE3-ERU3]|nr:hypothetical protein [Cardiobacteriaceae bacterium TAE3-ERU3]